MSQSTDQATLDDQSAKEEVYSLHELNHKKEAELLAIFKRGKLPSSMKSLDGNPVCLGLGVHILKGTLIDKGITRWARSNRFTWEGKSFRSSDDENGTGFNRLRSWYLGIITAFPFVTSIQPSVIDGKDCIAIDYDLPVNPWYEQRIYDELREISPGIFIGAVTLKRKKGYKLLCWFGVNTNSQEDHFWL